MARRVLGSAAVVFRRSSYLNSSSLSSFSSGFGYNLRDSRIRVRIEMDSQCISSGFSACKAYYKKSAYWLAYANESFNRGCTCWMHSVSSQYAATGNNGGLIEQTEDGAKLAAAAAGVGKVKRKKLKGKRAVVRWLKFFRWKKKKEYERMTAEEKILYKLKKAQRKEERLVQSLNKLEPSHSSETMHDPEILTPEEHFYYLKMGLKCKNYVPVGRRGLYQGVILNMHLHWKKHQTLKVVVKTFTPDEVKEIAAELARLTGGIVLDIHEENTIIMYRGKNYIQPPTEIMSPRVTLSRKKALDKSKCLDGLRAVRKYIPRLKQELELLRAQAERKTAERTDALDNTENPQTLPAISENMSSLQVQGLEQVKEITDQSRESTDEESAVDTEMDTDSENLSDCFETDFEDEVSAEAQKPLFLEEFDQFPAENEGKTEDFEEHLRNLSAGSRRDKIPGDNLDSSPSFDEVDRMFLRAASLLKKKRS